MLACNCWLNYYCFLLLTNKFFFCQRCLYFWNLWFDLRGANLTVSKNDRSLVCRINSSICWRTYVPHMRIVVLRMVGIRIYCRTLFLFGLFLFYLIVLLRSCNIKSISNSCLLLNCFSICVYQRFNRLLKISRDLIAIIISFKPCDFFHISITNNWALFAS